MTDPVTLAFGRQHDDRASLLFAASAAVLIHLLAVLIPLPRAAQPQLPPPPSEPAGLVFLDLDLRPPEPTRPPVDNPAPKKPAKVPVPFPDPEEQLPLAGPDSYFDEPVEIIDVPAELYLGDIEPPEIPTLVEEGREGLVMPVGIDQPQPDYPEIARLAGRSGRVILRAVVKDTGVVTDIEVLFAPTPDLGFSEEAIKAVSRWRYQPGELYGRPVSVRLTVSVEFTLH